MALIYNTPLHPDFLQDLGIPSTWTFGIADRTRFGEIDALGHINNTAYLRWLENFRISYFRDYGVADYQGTPPRLVVKSLAMEFRREMGLHQDYIVTGRTAAMRTSSFTMEYAVWSDGALCADGTCVMVWLAEGGGKQPLPDDVRATLIARDGTRDER